MLNEQALIDACLSSLEAQDYDGEVEFLVADGGSIDGTRGRLDWWARTLDLKVVDNPMRVQSHGLNLAAGAAKGEVLVRVDAHTTYEPDYVRSSVEALLDTGAVAVGGPMRPVGTTPFGRAVARALRTPLAVGPAPFHHAEARQVVDTVYLGAFRRSDFLAAGGMRTLPSGVAEDADLYFRWRQAGREVVLDPAIRSAYQPRQTPRALWRQFWRYGLGKADMLYVNGRWPSWRPLAPLVLVLSLVAGVILGLVWAWWPWWGLLAVWLAAIGWATRGRPMVVVAAVIMHLSYGLGLVVGLLRRPAAVRKSVSS